MKRWHTKPTLIGPPPPPPPPWEEAPHVFPPWSVDGTLELDGFLEKIQRSFWTREEAVAFIESIPLADVASDAASQPNTTDVRQQQPLSDDTVSVREWIENRGDRLTTYESLRIQLAEEQLTAALYFVTSPMWRPSIRLRNP